ncbi:hypothetical protein JCM3766R1_000701 [Sporobolomyces carnicolor]
MSSLSAQLHNEAADSLPRAAPSEEAASDASSASSDHEDTSDLAPSHILDGSIFRTAILVVSTTMLAFFHAMGKRRYCNYGDSSAPIRVGDLILIQMADIAKMTAITPKATAHMASYTQRLFVYLVRDVTVSCREIVAVHERDDVADFCDSANQIDACSLKTWLSNKVDGRDEFVSSLKSSGLSIQDLAASTPDAVQACEARITEELAIVNERQAVEESMQEALVEEDEQE